MRLSIPKDQLLNPIPPRVFLCNTARKKLGELPATAINLNAKWRTYSEISFEIQHTYVDLIDGVTKVHPLYDKVEAPRNVDVQGYGVFCLQDIDDTSNDNDIKSVTAFSLEYATSNRYLTNFHINTGEVDSVEVLFNEKKFGLDYNTDRDSFYTFATGFNAYESYYQREYTDADSYTYERVEISNEADYNDKNTASNPLYVKKFPNVQFFNDVESRHGLSLLHLVFEHIPEWRIRNVDQSLWHKERKFSENRISVYDFLMNKVSETFGCTFIWNSEEGYVDVVAEVDDDVIENEASTRFETDVYISKDNLASECKVSYSNDNIKTKLVVTGADNLDIREINLGRNEIMDLSFYHTEDWMGAELFEAYSDYLAEIKEAQTGKDRYDNTSVKYPVSYAGAMQGWVSANNKYHDIMHDIPIEANVLLVGDEFKKLFCVYTPIDADGHEDIDNEDAVRTSRNALIKKLNQYHVDEDTQRNKNDNILLKLKNSASDVVTIRLYNSGYDYAASYNIYDNYYLKKDDTYTRIRIVDDEDFLKVKSENNGEIYTNHYKIYSVIYRASSGVSGDDNEYEIDEWLRGELTAEEMGFIKYSSGGNPKRDDNGNTIPDYTVTYIGTMGAYFVLAKDEVVVDEDGALDISIDYLNSCGVNLLKEKHKVYTTLFQSQTEAMFSQEKYQCIIQGEQPEGAYRAGTRWLDSNAPKSEPMLYEYRLATKDSNAGWYPITVLTENDESIPINPTDTEMYNYENYQRYLDNFNKLKAVQEVLTEKERKAQYCLDGYRVDVPIVLSDGSSVPENFDRIIAAHFEQFGEVHNDPSGQLMDTPWVLYTFKISYDPESTFAVYLKDGVPYVAYANSQGVYQMIMDYIREQTEMRVLFSDDQLIDLLPFIKEDEYNDSNFLLTGYESEEERMSIATELMDAAKKELKSLCKPSLEFSMTMANLLALPEFAPLVNLFQLGNFIKVEIRDGYVRRTRLLEANINFDDLGSFSCTFGNLVSVKSEIDRHAELLSLAVTAGKTVAKSESTWQKTAEKTNKLEMDIANGLKDMALAIGGASGQAISWDHTGMHFRKYKEGSTTEFEPEEIAIINNSLVATNDSWLTSKAAFGKYTIDGEERWGPIAEYVTADKIEGKHISGGSLQIGGDNGEFIVTKDGEVIIRGKNNQEKYAAKELEDAYRFQVMLLYDGTTVFVDQVKDYCKITCEVYDNGTPITQAILSQPDGKFEWINSSDATWKPTYVLDVEGNEIPNQIMVLHNQIYRNSHIKCSVTFDETVFTKTEDTEEETEEGGASE